MDEDFFWGDLLGHIRQQVLVPVVGPDVTLVNVDGTEQDVYFADRPTPGGNLSPDRVVGDSDHGRGGGDWSCESAAEMRSTGCIASSTTSSMNSIRRLAMRCVIWPRLMTCACSCRRRRTGCSRRRSTRSVSRGGRRRVSSSFAPNQSTNAQATNNAQAADATETVVLNLFGQAVPTPQYAIHDEDRLEWLHALLSDSGELSRLAFRSAQAAADAVHRLRDSGLDRAVSAAHVQRRPRLSLERNSSSSSSVRPNPYVPSLSGFFETYCRQHAGPAAGHGAGRVRCGVACALGETTQAETARRRRPVLTQSVLLRPDAPSIFISYMREDARRRPAAVRRHHQARRGCVAGRAAAASGRLHGSRRF